LKQINLEEMVENIIEVLIKEPSAPRDVEIPNDYQGKRNLVRALLNIREPKPLNQQLVEEIDSLLQSELTNKRIVEVDKLESLAEIFPSNPFSKSDKLILWQGDITQLNADVIVNAANKQMLGCFQPLHSCIDNAINSACGNI
jgi:hypothetical protein